MERRDAMKSVAVMAAAAAAAEGPAAQVPGGPSAPVGVRDVDPVDKDYYVPGRFKGKTILVTGCARGMGAAAAIRAAREGANVVGVDWIQELGAKTVEGIVAAGGRAVRRSTRRT